jgi:hypothetical protein
LAGTIHANTYSLQGPDCWTNLEGQIQFFLYKLFGFWNFT